MTAKSTAIAANIEAMRSLIADALVRATEADQAMQAGEQNQAIGALIGIDEKLENALALYRAALALQSIAQWKRDTIERRHLQQAVDLRQGNQGSE
jgi:hypothetical protein